MTRAIAVRHLARQPVLGVDPKLVLVFEVGPGVDLDGFRRSGLTVLDASERRVIVAFADDPQLAAFHERLEAMQAGPPEGQKSAPHASFFDAIDSVRTLGAADRITAPLLAVLQGSNASNLIRLDVECWHPDNRDIARDWLSALADAVLAAGGSVADRYVNDSAGLILARVYLPADRVRELAELDFVARLDVLPTPDLSVPQLYGADPDLLPPIDAPLETSPIVGIIDSGVRSAHPLLAGAVVAADALGTGIEEGEDENGHGTMVAALVLHGRVDRAIARQSRLRGLCRIVSARVLDSSNAFPDASLWESDLAEALEWCAEQGASVINLSIGDTRAPLTTAHQTSGAAVVDDFARRHGIVVVACTGNIHPADYLDANEEAAVTYPGPLLNTLDARIVDPAPAALALTVGGMTLASAAGALSSRETVTRIPMGQPGWPSPFTRTGPGVGGSVKPELVDLAGTIGVEAGNFVGNDAELGVISAGAQVGRLLTFDLGTSFAAPFVTRVAAAVIARFPDFSANLVRALVLCSAKAPSFGPELVVAREADRDSAVRCLLGYGRPSIERATESTSHRVVLIAEDAIPINGVHIFEIPVPTSFFGSGGSRGIDVALAYDPRTRARRLDYMSSRMEFYVVRGMPIDEVAGVFAQLHGDADLDEDGESEDSDRNVGVTPPLPSQLRSQNCKLVPTQTIRSRGANQLGRVTWSQRLDREKHVPMHLVVRNINRWDDETATQTYGVAVAMWRSTEHLELYAELEERLEAVEVPVEIELTT